MKILTQEYLHETLHYTPETGVFTWNISPKPDIHVGDIAGCLNRVTGYIEIRINHRIFRSARLAWLYVHGKWPEDEIDIINGIRDDVRICNLREASRAEITRNQLMRRNNTSGVKGISWNKNAKKWIAYCTVNHKRHHLGLFTDIAEAEQVVRQFREEYHGSFANHGNRAGGRR